MRTEDTGLLELPPPTKKQKIDNLQRWLSNRFRSKQSTEIIETAITRRCESKKYFFGLRTRIEEITEKVEVGRKTHVLEEIKLSFAPKDLFFSIQNYKFDSKTNQVKKLSNTIKVPFKLEISRNHFENNLDADYRLNNFICHIDSQDRKSTRLNSSHIPLSRMPSSA